MRKAVVAAVVAALAVLPVVASADDKDKVPDVVGTWQGELHGMSVGQGPGPRGVDGTWEKPVVEDGKVVTRVTGQQGHYFWGVREFANGYKAKFMGMFSGPNAELMGIAESGAHYWGKVSDNRMQLCVMHTPMEGLKRFDLSCSDLTRTK
jgi:hypothetical protein